MLKREWTIEAAIRSTRERARLGVGVTAVMLTAVILAACGSSSSSSSSSSSAAGSGSSTGHSSTAAAGTKKPVKIGIVELLTADSFYQSLAQGAIAAGHALPGASVTVTGPPAPNPTTEVGDLTQLVNKGVNGVAVDPAVASLFAREIGTAAASTKVLTLDNPPVAGGKGSGTYIGSTNTQASDAMLNAMFSKLPTDPTGTMLIGICVPGTSSLEARAASYEAYAKAKAPHMQIVTFNSTTDPQQSLAAWQSALNAHPNAKALVGTCDVDGPSLARVHAEHPGNYVSGTYDVDPETLLGIKNGNVTAAINELPFTRGYIAAALLIKAAQTGKPLPSGYINLKVLIVTKHNVAAVIADQKSPSTGYGPSIQAYLKNPTVTSGPISLQPISDAYKK